MSEHKTYQEEQSKCSSKKEEAVQIQTKHQWEGACLTSFNPNPMYEIDTFGNRGQRFCSDPLTIVSVGTTDTTDWNLFQLRIGQLAPGLSTTATYQIAYIIKLNITFEGTKWDRSPIPIPSDTWHNFPTIEPMVSDPKPGDPGAKGNKYK